MQKYFCHGVLTLWPVDYYVYIQHRCTCLLLQVVKEEVLLQQYMLRHHPSDLIVSTNAEQQDTAPVLNRSSSILIE